MSFSESFLKMQETRIRRRIEKYLDFKRIKDELLSGDISPYTSYKQRRLVPILQKALTKIADGTYGACERCGSEIELKRLELIPAAERCIYCSCLKKKG